MTPEIAKILREPFPAEVVGKLPRIWCKACSDAAKARRTCDQHRKVRCPDCRNNITEAHLHLDYVGHAETTDRFLQADQEWTWEPLAFGADGLPQFDRNGGLWIRLTIARTTRLGYGAAQGKEGPDAVKEIIGDALRNAGMRFGVALDLWGATFKTDDHDDTPANEGGTTGEDWEAATPATAGQAKAFEDFGKELAEAPDRRSIALIGKRVHEARSARDITKSQYDLLDIAAGKRIAELELADKGETP